MCLTLPRKVRNGTEALLTSVGPVSQTSDSFCDRPSSEVSGGRHTSHARFRTWLWGTDVRHPSDAKVEGPLRKVFHEMAVRKRDLAPTNEPVLMREPSSAGAFSSGPA